MLINTSLTCDWESSFLDLHLDVFLVRSVEGSCAEAQLCFDSCYKDRYGYLPVVAGFPQNQTVGTCHKLWPNTPHT